MTDQSSNTSSSDTPSEILTQFLHDTDDALIDADAKDARATALAALDRYYKAETERVLREVIGGDEPKGYYNRSRIAKLEQRAEMRQRAANLGFNVKENK